MKRILFPLFLFLSIPCFGQQINVLGGYNTSQTSVTLFSGQGINLPGSFLGVWWNTTDWPTYLNDPYAEKIYANKSMISGDILIAQRGYGSPVFAHNIPGRQYAITALNPTSTPTITNTPTITLTPTFTPTGSYTPTPTPTPTFTFTPTPTGSATPTPTPTFTITPTPTITPFVGNGYVTFSGNDTTPVAITNSNFRSNTVISPCILGRPAATDSFYYTCVNGSCTLTGFSASEAITCGYIWESKLSYAP